MFEFHRVLGTYALWQGHFRHPWLVHRHYHSNYALDNLVCVSGMARRPMHEYNPEQLEPLFLDNGEYSP